MNKKNEDNATPKDEKTQARAVPKPLDQGKPREAVPGRPAFVERFDDKGIGLDAEKIDKLKPEAKRKLSKHKKLEQDDTEEEAIVNVPVAAEPEFMEKVIAINRITKVTKGGKKLSFSALVVVGDAKGKVGYSLSKAAEVSIAIRKAMAIAKKNMKVITMKGDTIPHEVIGRCGGARVLLKPASDGTGVIAAGPVRAICDGAGIHNILTKCHRSNNPINVIKATMEGLSRLKSAPVKEKVVDNASE